MPLIQDPETAYDLYRTGVSTSWARSSSRPPWRRRRPATPGFKQVPQFFDAYIGFNNKKTPLDNVKLRRALALAVDKKTLADKVLGGGGRRHRSHRAAGHAGLLRGAQAARL